MSEEPAPGGEFAEPTLRPRRHISPVWAVPIVALIAAGWLAYSTFSERGPTITITFRTGEGLESGKTRVKHNDVELGVVEKVALSPDLAHVIVTARMNREATSHLTSGTRFWVVRPRLSISNLSGLETLVSGAYVEMDPGGGDEAQDFVGLEDPPVVRADVPGREFILTTNRVGSIGPGTSIYFQGIVVGEVLGYEFAPTGKSINIHAFLRKPYDAIVYPGSRFWNDSGISLKAGPAGFKLEVESLQALLSGGVGFDSPDVVRVGEPAKEGTVFPLYPDHDTVLEASFVQRVPFIVEFNGSVHGLEVGAPVEFRGIKVGNVTDIRLVFDPEHDQVRIPVAIDFEPQRIERVGLAPEAPSLQARVMQVMNELVSRGMRAQLRTSSLLTGQLVVAFDFFPDSAPAKITFEGKIPLLPSVPSDFESLTLTATKLLGQMTGLLARVGKMPIEEVLQDARGVLQSFEALAKAPEIKDSMRTLTKTLADADGSLQRLDALVVSANTGYGGDSQVRRDVVELLRQLEDTAKSVKTLADSIEQHPESLLRGRGPQ